MSRPPDGTLADPQEIIADLRPRLAAAETERDEALAREREALEQQKATAEVLGVINSSPGELAPVFDAMLEKAMRLCEAVSGHFRTYDGNGFPLAAVRGEPEHMEAIRQAGPLVPGPRHPVSRFLCGENIVHMPNARESEEYRADARFRSVVDRGVLSLLLVALRKDGLLLGYINVYRHVAEPFTDRQIALLENFAQQAVIAMENARLITETREALEQQTATAEVLGVINSSPGDLAPVFDAMLEKAMLLCGASYGSLTVYDGGYFRCVAGFGLPDALFELLRQPRHAAPGSPQEQLLRGEAVVHIGDYSASLPSPDPVAQAAVEIGEVRTILFVPLRKDNRLLGYLTANRREKRPFSDKQIALLQNFAAQAVIAMENARLLTETREALEQQTATSEVLQVINASPGDLAPVFDTMLEKATRLCEAAFGMLWTYDNEYFRAVASHQVPQRYAEFLFANPFQPVANPHNPDAPNALHRMARGEELVRIDDVSAAPAYRSGDPRSRALVELGRARSYAAVALRKDCRLLGSIAVYRQEVRPFTDKQIALLQNFAAQAVIAMENARLITETREALEQQTATAEVLGVINSSPGDLAPVFDAMLTKALHLCEAAFGFLDTYDGERFFNVAQRGLPSAVADLLRQPRVPVAGSAPWRVAQGEPFVHLADLREDEGVTQGAPIRQALIEIAGCRTQLTVTLRKDAVLVGIFTIYRQEVRPFSDKQIALLQNFAAQAVIAMENARLLGELRRRTEEVAELNRGLEARVAEQVDELGRVGRLKRFLAPQLAELIVSQGDENILESHRREIVVVFCDLRGYTAFTETAEPEEVLEFLREYHGALGPLVSQFEGTLDQFSGDGIMVFFNDPVPIPDAAERAVKMAMAMRAAAGALIRDWRERGRELGFGAGIAQGYATLGQIGFSERSGYTAIGTVCNVAARLCAEAKDGQILLSQRVNVALKGSVATEQIGALALKGLTQPVVAYNVPVPVGGDTGGSSTARRRVRRTARSKPNGITNSPRPKAEARGE